MRTRYCEHYDVTIWNRPTWFQFTMMMLSHGNVFRITGALLGGTTGDQSIPLRKGQYYGASVFFMLAGTSCWKKNNVVVGNLGRLNEIKSRDFIWNASALHVLRFYFRHAWLYTISVVWLSQWWAIPLSRCLVTDGQTYSLARDFALLPLQVLVLCI